MCLFSKRMDRGRFVWPSTKTGSVVMTAAQLSMLLEGIDWRRPEHTFTPPPHTQAGQPSHLVILHAAHVGQSASRRHSASHRP